jgi:tRNA-modifying protein YgfZ
MPPVSDEFENQYAALTQSAGWVDFSDRTQIELIGADCAKFLHNLCTNAVRDLPVGQGCEAFLLNVKGHIVGHVFVFICPNSIVLETMPGQAEKLIGHLDRYLMREDVQLADRTQEWSEIYLAGQQASALLTKLGIQPPEKRLEHTAGQIAGAEVWLRRVDLTESIGYLVACHRGHLEQMQAALTKAGAVHCNHDVFETARIEAGTPLFDQDITDENLPQEINRDGQAISFTKGCYLGQETVARIDALGHVNRMLRGVKFEPSNKIPPVEAALRSGGNDSKTVGHVTSACWSPRFNAPLTLAFMHRESASVGTALQSDFGPAEVVALPFGTESEQRKK